MFKSKNKQAIEILKAQIEKPNNPDFNLKEWKVESSSLIQNFCGKESSEYKALNAPKIKIWNGYEGEKEYFDSEDINDMTAILKSAISTVRIKGVYKERDSTHRVKWTENIQSLMRY